MGNFAKVGSIAIGILGLIVTTLKLVFFTRHLINPIPPEKEMFEILTDYNWLIHPFNNMTHIDIPDINKWFPIAFIMESSIHGIVCLSLLIGKLNKSIDIYQGS